LRGGAGRSAASARTAGALRRRPESGRRRARPGRAGRDRVPGPRRAERGRWHRRGGGPRMRRNTAPITHQGRTPGYTGSTMSVTNNPGNALTASAKADAATSRVIGFSSLDAMKLSVLRIRSVRARTRFSEASSINFTPSLPLSGEHVIPPPGKNAAKGSFRRSLGAISLPVSAWPWKDGSASWPRARD
jgi:hypothetical protein